MKTAAVIGLGAMGRGVAKNLMQKNQVRGYDIVPQAVEKLAEAGGIGCTSPADAAKDADAVFVIVMNGQQAHDVIFGENGCAETLKEGSVVVVNASIGAENANKLAEEAEGHAFTVLDCPMTGGSFGADAGTLTLMVSGEQSAYEKVHDMLELISKKVYYVGTEVGLGQTVKSCLQAMVANTCTAAVESLLLGTKAGLDPEMLAGAISDSVVGSGWFRHFSDKLINRDFEAGSAKITTLYKDVNITLELAHQVHVPMNATSHTFELFQTAFGRFPNEDVWSIAKLYESQADEVIEKKQER